LLMKNCSSQRLQIEFVAFVQLVRMQLWIGAHEVHAVSAVVVHGRVWNVPSGHTCGKCVYIGFRPIAMQRLYVRGKLNIRCR
jgi:hypothetical protein